MLLNRIRELNREVARYSEPATPEESARRDALLQALAWYVHKLQMRVLNTGRSTRVSPGVGGYGAEGITPGATPSGPERASRAGAH